MDALLLIATELAISIHAPRVGCDGMTVNYNGKLSRISIPRTPGWGATAERHDCRVLIHQFQSTHPGWGATHILLCLRFQPFVISIHAPRVGCDFAFWKSLHRNDGFQSTHPGWGATYRVAGLFVFHHISIHAPRVGCDCPQGGKVLDPFDFNPRTPGGVRRGDCLPSLMRQADFNPRTPCGVRLFGIFILRPDCWISIHAPRVGCDLFILFSPYSMDISIHAPRVGCDIASPAQITEIVDFNPRTPGGVRLTARYNCFSAF